MVSNNFKYSVLKQLTIKTIKLSCLTYIFLGPQKSTRVFWTYRVSLYSIEWLNSCDVIIGQRKNIWISKAVCGKHQSPTNSGMRQTQGVTKLMGSHQEQNITWGEIKHFCKLKRCIDVLICTWNQRGAKNIFSKKEKKSSPLGERNVKVSSSSKCASPPIPEPGAGAKAWAKMPCFPSNIIPSPWSVRKSLFFTSSGFAFIFFKYIISIYFLHFH